MRKVLRTTGWMLPWWGGGAVEKVTCKEVREATWKIKQLKKLRVSVITVKMIVAGKRIAD